VIVSPSMAREGECGNILPIVKSRNFQTHSPDDATGTCYIAVAVVCRVGIGRTFLAFDAAVGKLFGLLFTMFVNFSANF